MTAPSSHATTRRYPWQVAAATGSCASPSTAASPARATTTCASSAASATSPGVAAPAAILIGAVRPSRSDPLQLRQAPSGSRSFTL